MGSVLIVKNKEGKNVQFPAGSTIKVVNQPDTLTATVEGIYSSDTSFLLGTKEASEEAKECFTCDNVDEFQSGDYLIVRIHKTDK